MLKHDRVGAFVQSNLIPVISKALHKQILFVFKFGVEAGLIDSGSHFQFVKTSIGKTAPPKNRQRLFQNTFAVRVFGRPIVLLSINESIGTQSFLTINKQQAGSEPIDFLYRLMKSPNHCAKPLRNNPRTEPSRVGKRVQ
jgi:hypothetical protein